MICNECLNRKLWRFLKENFRFEDWSEKSWCLNSKSVMTQTLGI